MVIKKKINDYFYVSNIKFYILSPYLKKFILINGYDVRFFLMFFFINFLVLLIYFIAFSLKLSFWFNGLCEIHRHFLTRTHEKQKYFLVSSLATWCLKLACHHCICGSKYVALWVYYFIIFWLLFLWSLEFYKSQDIHLFSLNIV